MTHPVKVGIVGASGYSGEVLVGLLARHPHIELAAVTSRSLVGQRVDDVLPIYREAVGDLRFTPSDIESLTQSDVELYFLALPHGVAVEYATALLEAGKRVIDLSADFRLQSAETYAAYYGHSHAAPHLLTAAPYVIPELANPGWKQAQLIACPGCYPTSVIVPLYPLLEQGILAGTGIVINSMSGVSGAGKQAKEFYSFSERAESALAYGAPRHRHLSEMEEQLSAAAKTSVVLQFTPHLVPMRRGIATTIVIPAAAAHLKAVYDCWEHAYGNKPFVHVLPSGVFPETRYTVGTNRIDISAVADSRTGNLLLFSAEDNLLKGASGQAVQIMNLWYGFDERAGLL